MSQERGWSPETGRDRRRASILQTAKLLSKMSGSQVGLALKGSVQNAAVVGGTATGGQTSRKQEPPHFLPLRTAAVTHCSIRSGSKGSALRTVWGREL